MAEGARGRNSTTGRLASAQQKAPYRDRHPIAELAIKAFELPQRLEQRWVKANYNAKRTILSIMLETVRLNSDKLEFSLRKPFEILRDTKLVPLIGASGTPVELFVASIGKLSQSDARSFAILDRSLPSSPE